MRKAFFIMVLAGASLNLLAQNVIQKNNRPITILIHLDFPLADSFQAEISSLVADYQNEYGNLPDTIWINSVLEFPNDFISPSTIAWGYSGHIILNELEVYGGHMTVPEFRHTFFHELSHTRHPRWKNAVFYQYYMYTSVVGYSGLTMIINGPTKNHHLLALEEGVAEAFYFRKYGIDSFTDIHYRTVGLFVLEILNKGWVSTDDLSQGLQTSDLACLAEKMVCSNNFTFSQKDIVWMIQLFEKVYITCDFKKGLRELENRRNLITPAITAVQ